LFAIAVGPKRSQPKEKGSVEMSTNRTQFLKFCLVGGLNTGIDFIVFTLLHLAGLPYLAAQCISYSCGVLNSYLINRTWTFQSRGTSFQKEGLKFICLNLVSLLVTSGLLVLLHQYVQFPLTFSKIISTAAGVLLNYVGNRLWVFEKSNQTRSGSICK
jgi:putative flippase GtrA